MATSTQWRVNITVNNGGGNLVVEEFQFRTTVGAPLAFPSATVGADTNKPSSGGPAAFAVDGVDTKGWIAGEYVGGPAATVGWWSFTYDTPIEVRSYVIQAGTGFGGAPVDTAPKDFTLEYWDGSAWVVADTKTNITGWANHECREFTVGSPSNSYQSRRGMYHEASNKWRFVFTASNGASQLGLNLLQMRKKPGLAQDAWTMSPGMSATATSENAPDYAYNAIANTTTNYWRTAPGVTAATFEITFGWSLAIRQYAFSVPPDSSQMPSAWTLEYWDGSAWRVADTQVSAPASTGVYTVTNATGTDTNDGDITLPLLSLVAPYDPVALPLLSLSGSSVLAAVYTGNANLGDTGNFGTAYAKTPIQLAAISTLSAVFNGDITLPYLDMDGALTAGLVLPPLDVAGVGFAGLTADLYAILPRLDVAGALDEPHLLPQQTLDAVALAGTVAEGDATLPVMDAEGSLEPPLPLPSLAAQGTLLAGGVADATLTLPLPDCAAMVEPANGVTLPTMGLAASGVAGAVGQGGATLAKATLAATAMQDGEGALTATLQPLSLSGVILSDGVATGAVALGQWSLQAQATTGQVMQAAISVPLLSLAADGFLDAVGTAHVVLPYLSLAADAISVAVAAPVFTTLTLNTRTKAVATHTVGYNSLAQFAGMTLAATPQGIVAIMGDADLGAPIDALVTSGLSDLGNEQMKRVLCGYVGYRAAGAMDLTLVTDQHHEYVYRLEPRQDAADLHASRVKTGRGVDGRYWQWTLRNTDGQAFDLDRLTFDANKLSRRA